MAGGMSGTDPSGPIVVKLPKNTLPCFNGNLMRWTAFSGTLTFPLSIPMDSSRKLISYLRSLLDHIAYIDTIAWLTLSAANYQKAVEVLKKRFGNTEAIDYFQAYGSPVECHCYIQMRDLRPS